jgi:hypothetical protein
MCRRRPYFGLVEQPQWIIAGLISVWWGNTNGSSMALYWLGGQPAFGIAPTGQRIPAQGATLGKIVDKSGAF